MFVVLVAALLYRLALSCVYCLKLLNCFILFVYSEFSNFETRQQKQGFLYLNRQKTVYIWVLNIKNAAKSYFYFKKYISYKQLFINRLVLCTFSRIISVSSYSIQKISVLLELYFSGGFACCTFPADFGLLNREPVKLADTFLTETLEGTKLIATVSVSALSPLCFVSLLSISLR